MAGIVLSIINDAVRLAPGARTMEEVLRWGEEVGVMIVKPEEEFNPVIPEGRKTWAYKNAQGVPLYKFVVPEAAERNACCAAVRQAAERQLLVHREETSVLIPTGWDQEEWWKEHAEVPVGREEKKAVADRVPGRGQRPPWKKGAIVTRDEVPLLSGRDGLTIKENEVIILVPAIVSW